MLHLASDYALSHGLVLRPTGTPPSLTSVIHAPYSLYPTKFPLALFHQARELQPLYNALYAHAAVDDAFLEEVVGGAVSKVDEFQGRLFNIWQQVKKEGIKQVSTFAWFSIRRVVLTLNCSSSPSTSACSGPTTSSTHRRAPRAQSTQSSR